MRRRYPRRIDLHFRKKELADPALLASEWEELADATGAPPFLYPQWIEAWWRAFGSGELEVPVERVNGGLTALLPLVRRRGSLQSPTNWHTPTFGVLASDSAAAESLLGRLLARRVHRLSLGFLERENGDLERCVAAAAAAGCRIAVRTLERSPYLGVEGGWARAEDSLPAKLVRDVRRRRRRLVELGAVAVDVQDGGERLAELLDEGFLLEGSGWKAAQQTAIRSEPSTERFYREIAAWAAARGWLRLAFIRLDGRPLAFQFGFEHGRVYYFLKGGYDPSFDRFSPGKLLVHAMLARAFGSGLRSFEFLGHAEPWKLEWTQTCRERVAFQAFAPSFAGSLEWLAQAYGRPLARRLGVGRLLTSRSG